MREKPVPTLWARGPPMETLRPGHGAGGRKVTHNERDTEGAGSTLWTTPER